MSKAQSARQQEAKVVPSARRSAATAVDTRDPLSDADQRLRSAVLAVEFRDMVLVLMVAVITYGGRTFTTLLVNDLVSGSGAGDGAAGAAPGADESARLMLLSAFYWGYAPPQLIGGWLAQKVGGKSGMNICLCGMALGFFGSWALLAAPQALLPLDVPTRLLCVAGCRFIDGLCQCL
jgi:MFS family permease